MAIRYRDAAEDKFKAAEFYDPDGPVAVVSNGERAIEIVSQGDRFPAC